MQIPTNKMAAVTLSIADMSATSDISTNTTWSLSRSIKNLSKNVKLLTV